MKKSLHFLTMGLLAASPALLHAQGSLTPPPGVPGPIMKTLDQVEARTPLVAGQTGVSADGNGTITISQRGSYYLTGNLTITTAGAHGIVVSSPNVTLDLNGFSLICTTVNGGDAISLGASAGCRIRNGSIVGGTTRAGSVFTLSGWNRGISRTGDGLDGSVSDLVIQGVRDDAIIGRPLEQGPMFQLVERCQVNTCGGDGIFSANVIDCQVQGVGGHAISTGPIVGGSIGSGIVSNCIGHTVGIIGDGISAPNGTVSNSRGIAYEDNGLQAMVAINSSGTSTWGVGLVAVNAQNCYGSTTSGSYGLGVSGTANGCCGNRPNGGVAISAAIAIGCTAESGTISSLQKHLGTP